MKITKKENGYIVLTTDDGKFISGIGIGQYVHMHPAIEGAIFISDKSNAQDYVNRLVIRASEVSEAFGQEFTGTAEELGTLLSENFSTAGSSASSTAEGIKDIEVTTPSTSTDTNIDKYHKANISWNVGTINIGGVVKNISKYEIYYKKVSDPLIENYQAPTEITLLDDNVTSTSVDLNLGDVSEVASRGYQFYIRPVFSDGYLDSFFESETYTFPDRVRQIEAIVSEKYTYTSLEVVARDNNRDSINSQFDGPFSVGENATASTELVINTKSGASNDTLDTFSSVRTTIYLYGGSRSTRIEVIVRYLSNNERSSVLEPVAIASRGTSTNTFDF